MGLSFAQHLRFLGVVSVAVGTTEEQGPSGTAALDGARAVRFTASGGVIYYKGGDDASTLDITVSGDSSLAGIPLADGANSGWLPGKPSDYYLGAGSTLDVLIEVMG